MYVIFRIRRVRQQELAKAVPAAVESPEPKDGRQIREEAPGVAVRAVQERLSGLEKSGDESHRGAESLPTAPPASHPNR